MEKIVMHWTAGGYRPSFFDRQFYHYLVDGEGVVHNGIYAPESNLDVTDGKYAAHCGGGNTGAIGVALCAMGGFKDKHHPGQFPIKPKQLEAFFALCARLALKYNIPITPKTVFTHYEFGLNHPKSSSNGKIDICYLPPYPTVSPPNTGSFIRQKIIWYMKKGAS